MYLTELPTELIEEILVRCDPIDVAQIAQTCRTLRGIVYCAEDTKLWRELYLMQPFDDPRNCISYDGHPKLQPVDWRVELQNIIRMRTIVTADDVFAILKPGELRNILQTLLNLVCNVPQSTSPFGDLSLNLVWVAVMFEAGFLDQLEKRESYLDPTERQLTARLHAYYGLTEKDALPQSRVKSRALVYSFQNYRPDNDYGPFHSSKEVNWEHVQALHHVVSMNLVDLRSEGEFRFTIFPLSLPFIQSIIPPEIVLDGERDWAGVAGSWSVSFCFCDHRDLLRYNDANSAYVSALFSNHLTLQNDTKNQLMDTTLFEDPDFREEFRSLRTTLYVSGTRPDPDHPTRPIIDFYGEMMAPSTSTMHGHVQMTKDHQIQWHFSSGDQGHSIWSSEGIQVGGIRSSYGVLGSWTTVFHDDDDPVGTHAQSLSSNQIPKSLKRLELTFLGEAVSPLSLGSCVTRDNY